VARLLKHAEETSMNQVRTEYKGPVAALPSFIKEWDTFGDQARLSVWCFKHLIVEEMCALCKMPFNIHVAID
jgi:hypothetical protein